MIYLTPLVWLDDAQTALLYTYITRREVIKSLNKQHIPSELEVLYLDCNLKPR